MPSDLTSPPPEPAAVVVAATEPEVAESQEAQGEADAALAVAAAESDSYRISLEAFEGPMDLLLHLIKEDELEITDIPIARITDQYLETIAECGVEDLDQAGEYLLMAATLMRIKSRMLIPRDPDDEDEEDEIDPRAELMRRLLEYRAFKSVAENLGIRQEEWRGIMGRNPGQAPVAKDTEEFSDPGVSLVDLFRAFRNVLDALEEERTFDLETEEYSVDEQMQLIRAACFRSEEGVPFSRLFATVRTRPMLITTFLALLELIREREVRAIQAERFGEIWLKNSAEVSEVHDQ